MAESIAPEFTRFIAAERGAARLTAFPRPTQEGEIFERVFIPARRVNELARVAARRASGLVRPSKRTEVVWVEGENELAVAFAKLTLKLDAGLLSFTLPVRSDQTGKALIRVLFALGSRDAPAGLYAAASRRPEGPAVIVDAWGDALVAFSWHCLLELVAGVAGAAGKDRRGNVLVPAELSVSKRGIEIVPMARHRFAGSSSLERRQ